MFTVIYIFEVKKDKKVEFISYWKDLTNLIYNHCGSLGSRLHKESTNKFMAYALWPSKEIFDAASSKLPEKGKFIGQEMRSCCVNIKVEIQAKVVADLIRS